MNFTTKNLILLTGAGFTKNFGGFLGTEMWSKIFNDSAIQANKKLRDLLEENDDFEAVYSTVMKGVGFTDEDKKTMQQVVEAAYKSLDEVVRNWVFNEDNPIALNTYGLGGDLLNLFVGSGKEKGLFFTLNQDLFMERHNNYRSPGAPHFPQEFYSLSKREFQPNYFITLPDDEAKEKMEKQIESNDGLLYIKLHGSYGWRSSNGLNQMVIGKNKEDDIKNEPLLKAYFELFENTIKEGGKKLLVIGYGFRDLHINQLLLAGVQNYGLKLYVLTTGSWQNFRDNFRYGHYYAYQIVSGVAGYFPYSLREVFPPNQNKTVQYEEIRKSLLSK